MHRRHLIRPQTHFYSLWNVTHLWFACPCKQTETWRCSGSPLPKIHGLNNGHRQVLALTRWTFPPPNQRNGGAAVAVVAFSETHASPGILRLCSQRCQGNIDLFCLSSAVHWVLLSLGQRNTRVCCGGRLDLALHHKRWRSGNLTNDCQSVLITFMLRIHSEKSNFNYSVCEIKV